MLLHGLAGQGVARLACIVIVDNLGFVLLALVGFGFSDVSQPRWQERP